MWFSGLYPPFGLIRVYTEASKRGNRVDGGFIIEDFGIKSYFRLLNFSTGLKLLSNAVPTDLGIIEFLGISVNLLLAKTLAWVSGDGDKQGSCITE